MKSITEQTIASILNLDSEISSSDAQQAMRILNGLPKDSNDDFPLVLRFEDAAKLLKTTPHTIYVYARHGILDKIYGGCDHQALGITTESYLRFIEEHTVHIPPAPEEARFHSRRFIRHKNFEHRISQARWKCHLKQNASYEDRYDAIDKLLKEDSTLSINIASKAVGVSPSSYIRHKQRLQIGPTIYQKRRMLLMELINKLHPNKQLPVSIWSIVKEVRQHRVGTSYRLIKELISTMGYIIKS